MATEIDVTPNSWQTKPSDRFVLKWIKTRLSARITPKLLRYSRLQPWMITILSAGLGVLAGFVFALGFGWIAGTIAAFAQVLDGVDGQFARITGRQSNSGAYLDSILDRYGDGAMAIGLIIYLVKLPFPWPSGVIIILGAMALIGSNLVSYSSARAESLGLDLGGPTLASKGTRSAVMILCAWGSILLPGLPILALVYLAFHTNIVVVARLVRVARES